MYDHANVVIAEVGGTERTGIFFCTSEGAALPERVRQGLQRDPSRWQDSPRLAASVFEEMMHAEGAQGEPVMSTRLLENDGKHDILVLLADEQKIVPISEDEYKKNGLSRVGDHPSMTFNEFVKSERDWEFAGAGSR